jgi:hypothetical protein
VAEGTGVAVARQKDVAEHKDNAKIVLGVLAHNKAMPLLELMSVVELPDDEVQKVVEGLEKEKLVSISQRGTLDEIVTISWQGLRAAG